MSQDTDNCARGMPMTHRRGMTNWRWALLCVFVLWLVLLLAWFRRDPGPEDPVGWLTFAVALLPLLLVNEVWTILTETLRRRRAGKDGDA